MIQQTPALRPHTSSPVPRITLRIADAAIALSVSERTLTDLVARNAVPSFIVGNIRLFEVAALQRWAAERTAESTG